MITSISANPCRTRNTSSAKEQKTTFRRDFFQAELDDIAKGTPTAIVKISALIGDGTIKKEDGALNTLFSLCGRLRSNPWIAPLCDALQAR